MPRFTLQPGEVLCLDNYRMLHGRDRYTGNGVPDGVLHSDSGYAGVER